MSEDLPYLLSYTTGTGHVPMTSPHVLGHVTSMSAVIYTPIMDYLFTIYSVTIISMLVSYSLQRNERMTVQVMQNAHSESSL